MSASDVELIPRAKYATEYSLTPLATPESLNGPEPDNHNSIVDKTSQDDVPIDDREDTDEEHYHVEQAYEVALKVLSTRDNPELQAMTFRTVFLGLGFSAFGSVLAQFYYFKPQSLSVSTLLLLILSYFFGNAMHILFPSKGIFRWINPGPFNIKEHAAIVIMSSTAATSATAIQVISVQALFYNNNMNPGIAIFTLLGSQLIGYGFAGLLQDVLVKPTKCFWPSNIQVANLFQAFHYDRHMTSKRVRMFWVVFAILFCWEIVPEWMFPVLTGVSVFCLADNHSPVVRNIFGGATSNEGLGLLQLCLDWNLISSLCFWAPLTYQLNIDVGIFVSYILMSAVYYANLWKSQQFPFLAQALFAEDGTEYNQSAILTNGRFDPVKYQEQGPAYLTGTFALSLVLANLSIGALITHICLWNRQDVEHLANILNPWHQNQDEFQDPHWMKMSAYKPIPYLWYPVVLLSAYAIAQATNYTGDSGLPWWALTVILIISFILTALCGTLIATLGFSTNALGFYEMITAYFVPGNPVANMYGSLYGAQPMIQAFSFLADLKLGIYVKLPPRVTFFMQLAGTIVGALLNYVVMRSIVDSQREALLSPTGTRLWSGLAAQIYNTNAVAWGALGPELFSASGMYHMVPIALAIGVFLPLPFYIAHRFWPNAGFQHFNSAIIMQYAAELYGGINCYINTSMVIGIFTHWWVRTRYPRWFVKYNYIVAAAMEGGTQVVIFILNFVIFGATGTAHPFPQWWGNDFSLSADRCLLPTA